MTYDEARRKAQELADEFGCDYGIERNAYYPNGGFAPPFALPRRENRYGYELRCEVVHPHDPSTCQPGHGP